MYLGDFAEDVTIVVPFTTTLGGAGVAPSTALAASDVIVVKDGTSLKATANGISVSESVGGTVGAHSITLNTSTDTGDAGFWVAGSDYAVLVTPEISGQTLLSGPVVFSLANRL